LIFPENFEEKIGFDQVRRMLKTLCVSRMGEIYVEKIRFHNRFDILKKILGQTEEFRQILMFGKPFPAQNYFNLIPELERISIPGTFIFQESLFDLKTSLESINDVLVYLKELDESRFPLLLQISSNVEVDRQIMREIDRIINEKGQIKDNASDKLKEIRQRLVKLSNEIDKAIRQVLITARKNGWVNPNDDLTLRDGRLVIPVPATHKRKIRGFIHDESATGQTVFIEPAEALEANNEIRELENAEKREIIRILTDFTNLIRPEIDQLIAAYQFLGLVDFIRAKAKFAIQIEAVLPLLNDKTIIEWFDAKHPLLFLSHKNQKKQVETLSLKLDENQRILVISGPNAGGKSVCLKTVGLLQYMLQCGLLVPMRETSETGIFRDIFIDIGDEQSIENDLSTYTSHLRNMKFFSLKSGRQTLFLIDEFGTGTEPQLGGAIAEAVLEHLNRKLAFGVVTTHYTNLKMLADKTLGLVNGAMLFDTRQMQPLFKLQMGNPGSSFAFEIARKTGFPTHILQNAEKKIGKGQLKFEEQLQQLELEKKELNEKQKEMAINEEKLKMQVSKYNQLVQDLEASKTSILKEAKSAAAQVIAGSNKLVENTIREIRENQAEKEKTKQLREKLKEEAGKIEKAGVETKASAHAKVELVKKKVKPVPEIQNILVGNRVRISPQQTVGEVIEIIGDDAVVSFGSVIMKTPLSKIVNVGEEELHQKVLFRRSNYGNIINEINAKMQNFKLTLDLRGQRAEEAIPNLQKYIDEAILLSIKEVRILHGKGNGILRDIIRSQLRAIPEIKKFNDEHIEQGGHGITVVSIK
jgi:DNA mismatch repair protein MutS2